MNNSFTKWGEKPYYSIDHYLKTTYGEKLYKIAIDAGFTCPNRDGTLSKGGCIFCSAGGSGDFAIKSHALSVDEQIKNGLGLFHDKKIGTRFIAYFQAYTNTYAPVDRLRSLYEAALSHPDIAGISIATRPDCLGKDVLTLLDTLQGAYPDKFIWVELGLQTVDEATAAFIRRGYPLSVFDQAVSDLAQIGIPIIVHVILGLPCGDADSVLSRSQLLACTNQKIMETICHINTLHIFGIKLQLLHILKDTDLATYYEQTHFPVYSEEEYLQTVIDCICHLSPDITIHRVTGDGPKELLIAPTWSQNKRHVLNTLHKMMKEQAAYQGRDMIP